MALPIDIDAIEAAREVIAARVHRTPILSSKAAAARNSWKADRLTVFEGMPATISGAVPGAARTCPAWQPAQFRKMRSMPIWLRNDVPTGRARPSSGGRFSAGS